MESKDFENLFDRYFDDVIRVLSFYSGNREQVEDWAHDIFMRIWELREKIDVQHPQLKAYIMTIARNHALRDLGRSKRLETPGAENMTLPGHDADANLYFRELTTAYENALSDMAEKPRKAFIMSRELGFNYRQISDALGISVKTVEAHISSALRILRQRLKDYQ